MVTEEKISKWTDELAAMDHRGLLPLSQALYASILAVDDRDAANNDKKKQKKMDKMTDKMTSTTEIFPIICSSVIEKVPEFLLKSFEVNSKSAAGQISQCPMWKKCKRGLKVRVSKASLFLPQYYDFFIFIYPMKSALARSYRTYGTIA